MTIHLVRSIRARECGKILSPSKEAGACVRRFADRYSLEKEIGQGSTAQVFEARDAVNGRRVAVKVLYAAQSDKTGDGFRRESRAIASFSHPNIVQVCDMGLAEFGDRAVSYVVMEYLPDGDLMSLIERHKRLPERRAARIAAGAAAALAYAHERGVIHEDVKPQNILLEDLHRAKLTDFNVLRSLRPGDFPGAPRYAAPEAFRGEPSPAGDVYSLGVTVYQAVVGGPPFRGDRRTVIRQHVEEPPIPPGERSPISRELNDLIMRSLNKNPSERPAAADMKKKLRSISWQAIYRSPVRDARLWVGRRLMHRNTPN